MNTKHIGLYFLIIAFITSCASDQSLTSKKTSPSWIKSPPADTEHFLFAPGQNASAWQGTALQNAQQSAEQAMAAKLETKVSALERLFKEETGESPHASYDAAFSDLSKQFANGHLSGVTRSRAECIQLNHKGTENSINQRCFVLVRMPVSEARSAIVAQLSKNKELFEKLKTTNAYNMLQNNLHELE